MDKLDEELLQLSDSGVVRYSDLAKKVNAPLSTVHIRMKKLESQKVIRHYKSDIDWKKAGLPLTAFILIDIDVSLLQSLKRTQDKMLKELLSLQYVKEGYVITGEADLFVKVLAKDSAHLKDILLNHIDRVQGVVRTKTIVVLD
jgi:Lrp/AsnC family transcriptional regulator, regulator for asnA, asnC and gidA